MTYGRLEGAVIAGIVARSGDSAGPPQPQPEKMMEGRKVPSVVFKTRVRDESVGGPNPFR